MRFTCGAAVAALAVAVLGCVELGLRGAHAGPHALDHIGAWSCVLYGNPRFGEERMFFRFAADGSTAVARVGEDALRPWAPAPVWRVASGSLEFSDPRTSRDFVGDLTRATLGGTWRSQALTGGWWCSTIDETQLAFEEGPLHGAHLTAVLPPLHPLVMATPSYPREAIRQAKQGRAVVCFMVDSTGSVFAPDVVELSDEVFRRPSLDSLARSRYRGWEDEKVVRPGCRSFIYRLDAIYQ